MNSETVDLIATDPPFNKNRDFHATPDSLAAGSSFQDRWSWEKDVHESWTDKIVDDYPKLMEAIECARYAHSDGMGAYMCFMAVRLMEMKRLLKPTGSICLHCDQTASHYLKTIMDAIFGYKNFKNELIWHYSNASRGKKQWAKSHDIVLWYVVDSKRYTFNRDDILVPYTSGMTKWRYERGGQKGKPMPKGKTPDDVIIMPSLNANDKKERYGYPTQKPLALYEHLIIACSRKNDVVLDPFAGCATTLVASERKGRQWVGIDIWKGAHDAVLDRLEKEGLGVKSRKSSTRLFSFGEVCYTKELPERTDDGEDAVPHLRVKEKVAEPEGKKWTRAECMEHLLKQHGSKCQGCCETFRDPRYLQLDHITPRADGGINHVSNRILLCGPCNRLKSHKLTLSGLRIENAKRGYMVT